MQTTIYLYKGALYSVHQTYFVVLGAGVVLLLVVDFFLCCCGDGVSETLFSSSFSCLRALLLNWGLNDPPGPVGFLVVFVVLCELNKFSTGRAVSSLIEPAGVGSMWLLRWCLLDLPRVGAPVLRMRSEGDGLILDFCP